MFRVVALPAPTERERSQMYIQRYLPHLPAAGEVVIFDRSWYNRAGVERVMGFCTPGADASSSSSWCPAVEQAMVDSGIILLKYWLEVSPEEQTRRLESRIDDRARSGSSPTWTSSPTPAGTTTPGPATTCSRRPTPPGRRGTSPHSDDKKRARLNVISHLLSQVPYEPLEPRKVTLPERKVHADHVDLPVKHIPTPF